VAGEPPRSEISFVQRGDPRASVTIEIVPREMRMHQVTDDELRQLRSGANSSSLTLFGVAIGGAITIGVTLGTVELTTSVHATFVASFIATVGLTLFFGFNAVRDYLSVKRLIQHIERQHTGRHL
jgi:hypothetical protein